MPVRRSARLKSINTAAEDSPTDSSITRANVNKNKQNGLGTVVEREEPPTFKAAANAATSTQPTPTTPAKVQTNTPKSTHFQRKSPVKTPTTSVTRPNHFEMHPSKVHQSTTKQPDSGLILGFTPVKKDAQGNVVKDNLAQNTPSKTNQSPASAYYGTPAFEFKFSSQDSQLSDEAKKLMESVREDVARIKANIVHDKATNASNETLKDGERKIAKPKGKANRFSDVHMAEFKKMDSIAGHASAFRATPGRFQPIQKTLKRTNSKARLDESETQTAPARATPQESTPTTPAAKRVKQDNTATHAATTPSRLAGIKSAISRPRSSVRSSLLTPTRASMARASVSLKPPRTTMIPSLARSPLSRPAEAPTTPRTEFNPRFKSNIPTWSSLKSILRPHQPLFSKDPAKIAAGTHQTAPDFTPDLLLQPSRESSHQPAGTPSPKKRVEFTPCTKPRQAELLISPSPSKNSTSITYPSTCDVVYPTLPTLTPERGSAHKPTTIRPIRPSEAPVEATLPEIPGMPHGLSHKKRHRVAEDEADRENVPPVDEPSQERSVKRVKMSSPSKMVTSSPLKSRSRTPLRPGSGAIRKGTPSSARSKSGLLNMSRLNMLSQPKHRS
ncbi:hypothetical protein BDV12DRAFT_194304 [Aspergillus spectabilis]